MLQLLFTHSPLLTYITSECVREGIRSSSPEFHAEAVITRTASGLAFQLPLELQQQRLRRRD